MTPRPLDTSPDAWEAHLAALGRLGAQGRVLAALELSEAVRSIQLAGIRARHPEWDERDAVRHLVATQLGVVLPRELDAEPPNQAESALVAREGSASPKPLGVDTGG